jgi:hypothetical protein
LPTNRYDFDVETIDSLVTIYITAYNNTESDMEAYFTLLNKNDWSKIGYYQDEYGNVIYSFNKDSAYIDICHLLVLDENNIETPVILICVYTEG